MSKYFHIVWGWSLRERKCLIEIYLKVYIVKCWSIDDREWPFLSTESGISTLFCVWESTTTEYDKWFGFCNTLRPDTQHEEKKYARPSFTSIPAVHFNQLTREFLRLYHEKCYVEFDPWDRYRKKGNVQTMQTFQQSFNLAKFFHVKNRVELEIFKLNPLTTQFVW